MKTYLKTLVRTFKKHITRFISIICMVLVSVGFIAGLGSAVDKINYSMCDYYENNTVSDFIIKDASGDGFDSDDEQTVKSLFAVKAIDVGMSVDVNITVDGKKQLTRLYFIDFDMTVNKLDTAEGEKPEDNTDMTRVYADEADNKIKGYDLGTEIELDFKDILTQLAEQDGKKLDDRISLIPDSMLKKTVKVSGTVQSPLTFAKDGEPSYTNPPDTKIPETIDEVNKLITLENILYVSKDLPTVMGMSLLPSGDMYVAIEDRTLFNAYSAKYNTFAEENAKKIVSAFGKYDVTDDNGDSVLDENGNAIQKNRVEVLTLNDNYSFISLYKYGQKVMYITIVLMIAFLFVTALVVLSTMTRLMDEERSQIACLRTLGYSSAKINFKYVLFAMIATCLGGGLAYLLGWGLASLLYFVFNYSFSMPPMSAHAAVAFYFITVAVIIVATLIATLISGAKMAHETPANLLRPKPPKAGKKVILERIPFIWNKLSFKYKSTLRNVLRYKSRFFMTVIAVAVSTGLVVAGLALLEVCLNGLFASVSIMIIAIVVVAFAGLLTVVVIYTLTNINVSERNRELATLMVLGYHDKEVSWYIYREIYIDTAVGIIFGYPVGYLLKWIVFKIMGVATTLVWSAWVFAPVIVLLFTAFVTLILRRKIVKINMNDSLKAIE